TWIEQSTASAVATTKPDVADSKSTCPSTMNGKARVRIGMSWMASAQGGVREVVMEDPGKDEGREGIPSGADNAEVGSHQARETRSCASRRAHRRRAPNSGEGGAAPNRSRRA